MHHGYLIANLKCEIWNMKLSLHAIRYMNSFLIPSLPPMLAHLLFCRGPFLYICRGFSTNQTLFMQNKPNFQKSQMNLNIYNTTNYENETYLQPKKTNPNKPNSNPIYERPKWTKNRLLENPATPSLCKAQLFITIGIIGQIILKINK